MVLVRWSVWILFGQFCLVSFIMGFDVVGWWTFYESSSASSKVSCIVLVVFKIHTFINI